MIKIGTKNQKKSFPISKLIMINYSLITQKQSNSFMNVFLRHFLIAFDLSSFYFFVLFCFVLIIFLFTSMKNTQTYSELSNVLKNNCFYYAALFLIHTKVFYHGGDQCQRNLKSIKPLSFDNLRYIEKHQWFKFIFVPWSNFQNSFQGDITISRWKSLLIHFKFSIKSCQFIEVT